MKETNKNKTTNFWIFGIIAIIFIFLTYQFDVESKTKIFCIPDDNYRNTIKINYPHCLNDNNELIISEAEKVIEINVDSRNIKNLEGLQFF